MVFPIADEAAEGRTSPPFVNYALIAANVFVFVVLQGFGKNDDFTYAFSTVPEEIRTGEDIETGDEIVTLQDPRSGRSYRDPRTGGVLHITRPGLKKTPISVYLTLLTSMFMHGGLAHIFGNMLFLWIFGDNIEDVLGHFRYLIFYLVCGILASIAHVLATYAFDGNPMIPSLGASGAISGVLGGYILLHPFRRVTVIMFRILTEVPAYVAIGLWFVFQLIEGLGMLGGSRTGGGVAYAAHIGGFIAGVMLIHLFALGRPPMIKQRTHGRWVQR